MANGLFRVFTIGTLGSLLAWWGGIGGAVGLFLLLMPTMTGFLPPLVLVAFALLIGSLVAYTNVVSERDKYKHRLEEYLGALPRLECSGQKLIPLYINNIYQFHVLQVWICNRPDVHGPGSRAEDVSVRVSFFTESQAEPLFTLGSQWVESIDPNAAGYRGGPRQNVDIPASDNPAKFFLVLQHPNQTDCYVHSFGILHGQPDGRSEQYRLPQGRYKVRVFLRGTNVNQELDLPFVNHGDAEKLEIPGYLKQHEQEAKPSHGVGEPV